ncbi:MAG TPA: vanadium-dependent haloperoxidase [Steroidobacteraceae bacterium]|nr:vanadium-dependent haloperoxidase [Steroidobacteraceae bacterium]
MRINYLVTPGVVLAAILGTANASAASPNIVEQWNKIAEDTVVASGAFQGEGEVYMAYVSAAVYDAVVAINGRYKQLGTPVTAPPGASTDAAVIEAAYDTLVYYFHGSTAAATLNPLYITALAAIPDGTAKTNGQAVGLSAALSIIAMRSGDGRLTPIGTSSAFLARTPGPGVYRLTPPAYAPPQTPWVGSMKPWGLQSPDQFLPEPPPDLRSDTWANAFAYMRAFGVANSTVRTAEQTAIAEFYSANAIRQFNLIARDFADAHGLDVVDTARLAAMINVVLADAGMAFFRAKYHYLFWRPVTAIDPASVKADGFGPVPGYDDGNPSTAEQSGWRPLLATPNHPEYPSAHCTFTSAVAEILSRWLGTNNINIDVHGFDPAGPPGNLNAVRHFATAADEREEVSNARIWGGLHYSFSTAAGLRLGRQVANYDLHQLFGLQDQP